ncbi:MAG: hypothetical protein JSV56_08660, partial [Methanomassiliicoccales archaeon]
MIVMLNKKLMIVGILIVSFILMANVTLGNIVNTGEEVDNSKMEYKDNEIGTLPQNQDYVIIRGNDDMIYLVRFNDDSVSCVEYLEEAQLKE